MAFMLDSFSPSSFDDSLSSSPMLLLNESPRRALGRSASSSALPSRSMAWSSGFRGISASAIPLVFPSESLTSETLIRSYEIHGSTAQAWKDSGGNLYISASAPLFILKQDKGDVKVNWLETPKAHVLKVDLPGLAKEDIKLNPHGERGISIRGERKKDVENEGEIWRSVEAAPGRFRRDFELPEDANVAEMTAAYSDGVLTITVPKKEDPVKYVEIA